MNTETNESEVMRDDRYKVAIDKAVATCSGFNAPSCSRAVISSFLGEIWQPMEISPTAMSQHNGAASVRVLLWVPPYGATTGHYDNGWHLHSILNKEAKPTHWMHLPEAPKEQSNG